MSPNDPRAALRARILELCGYVTTDNGVHYTKKSVSADWTYVTSFPYSTFHALDKFGRVQDAWIQEYPGDAK